MMSQKRKAPATQKKQVQKKFKKKQYMATPSRNLGPLGVSQKVNFIYHDYFQLNPGALGVPAAYVFSANGVYDPNTTGVGHQPRGFDQLVGVLYDHAVVIGVKITLYAQNTDGVHAQLVTAMLRDEASSFSTPSDIQENRYVKTLLLGQSDSGTSAGVLTFEANPNQFLGRTSPLSDPDLKNSASSNPAEGAYIHLYGMPMSGTSDSSTIYCQARIEYTAILIEPKQPGAS